VGVQAALGALADEAAEDAGDADAFRGKEDVRVRRVAGAKAHFGGAVGGDGAAAIEPVEVFEGGVPIAAGASGDDGGDFALADGIAGADEDEVFVEDSVAGHGIAFDAEEKVARACVEEAIDGNVFGVVAGDDLGQRASGDGAQQGETARGAGGADRVTVRG
jgi:hypothetical protein